MKQAYFIAGTDTGIGKTALSAGLLTAWQAQGLSTLGLKPIACGGEQTTDGVFNEDALLLQKATSLDADYHTINPFCLAKPVSPNFASDNPKEIPSVDDLVKHTRMLLDGPTERILVEGCGGWLVPLNQTETLADFACALKLPVILVVGIRLGCLSHSLLSQAAILASGLKLQGWVANIVEPETLCIEKNIETLKNRISAPLLATIPYLPDFSIDKVAESLQQSLLCN